MCETPLRFGGKCIIIETEMICAEKYMKKKRIWLTVSIIVAVIAAISIIFHVVTRGIAFVLWDGDDLNLDGYELVFYDEFDGDSLDTSVWEHRGVGPVPCHGDTLNEVKYKGYFNHPDQVSVEDGCLFIEGEYTTNEYGEGWYSDSIRLKDRYTYGYFEIKCIPNDSEYFWSAFWLQSDHSYEHDVSQGGTYGAELDVFETYKEHTYKTKNFISSTIHCNGSDEFVDRVDSHRAAKTYIKDLRSEFTTFGMMWTEEEYVFYVNGVETGRTSFANGTSRVAEEVIVSLCAPDQIDLDEGTTTRFVVDYVKIYQLSGK